MSQELENGHPVRWIVAASGLIGAAGVAAAAAAAHGSDARLFGAASAVCLAHAPALLALGLAGRHLPLRNICAALLSLGTLLFAGDLGMRAFLGIGLFAGAAPTGGTIMIFAWLLIALAAALTRSRSQ